MTTGSSLLDRYYKTGVAGFAWAAVAWLILKAGSYLEGIVALFGITTFLTYLLLGPVNLMEPGLKLIGRTLLKTLKLTHLRRFIPNRLPRALAILLAYVFTLLCIIVFSLRLVPVATNELTAFTQDLPSYVYHAEEWLLNQSVTREYFHREVEELQSKGAVKLPSHEAQRLKTRPKSANGEQPTLTPTEKKIIREKVFTTTDRINHFLQAHIGGTLHNLFKIISTTLTGFVYALTGLVVMFYFLLDGDRLRRGFVSLWPRDTQKGVNRFLTEMHGALFGYTKGYILLGIIAGIFVTIVTSILGMPYSLFLGTFFAFARMIPMLGSWLGFLPWLLIIHSVEPWILLVAFGLVILFLMLKKIWITPKILGHVTGLHPVIVLLSLLVCAKVAGLLGILFALPLASTVNVLIRFAQEDEKNQFRI